MTLLEFKNTSRTYTLGQENWELGPLNFSIDRREDVAIVGSSGSGKSTLLHLAAALAEISNGEIFYEGQGISTMSEKQIQNYRKKEIGFVFQDFYLFPEFNLLENVAMPLIVGGFSQQEARKKAEKAIHGVGLSSKVNHLPRELSGGERQRGAIARAIVHSPKILFADEPTGNLDSKTGEKILKLLKDLHTNEEITFVIVTHDEKIASLLSRVITLEDGKVIGDTKKEKRKTSK